MKYSLLKVAANENDNPTPETTPTGDAPASNNKPSAWSNAWGKTKEIGNDIYNDTTGFLADNWGALGIGGLVGALAAIPGQKRNKLERLLTGLAAGIATAGVGIYGNKHNWWRGATKG